jgi:hypothetical protein
MTQGSSPSACDHAVLTALLGEADVGRVLRAKPRGGHCLEKQSAASVVRASVLGQRRQLQSVMGPECRHV